MLCNITGTMMLPDGTDATGVVFTLIPSVNGVVMVGTDNVAMTSGSFRVGQGGAVDVTVQSGEYTLRSDRTSDTVIYVPPASDADVSQVFPLAVYQKQAHVFLRQGDTFQLGAVYCNDYNIPQDLTGVTVTASMRVGSGVPVELDVVVTSEERGEFTISLDAEDTEGLPVGLYEAQVVFELDGIVKSSIGISVNVVEGF